MNKQKLIDLMLDRKPIGDFNVNTKDGLQIDSYSLLKLLSELEKEYSITNILGTKSIHRILNSKEVEYNPVDKGIILNGYKINIIKEDLVMDLDNKFYVILKDFQENTQYCIVNVRGTVKSYRPQDKFKMLDNAVKF